MCTCTYEWEVLGFPDVVVIDGDENDPNRSISDKVDRYSLHTHMHSMFPMNMESCWRVSHSL